jgi:hypothetical protein
MASVGCVPLKICSNCVDIVRLIAAFAGTQLGHLRHLPVQMTFTSLSNQMNISRFPQLKRLLSSHHQLLRLPNQLLSDGPFQPQVNTIRPQHLGRMKTRVLHFQRGWFQKYKWLHYVPSLQGVPCFTCAKADRLHLVDLANKRDPAFITNGFRNWKKALERFRSHESSQCHNFSYMHAVAKN